MPVSVGRGFRRPDSECDEEEEVGPQTNEGIQKEAAMISPERNGVVDLITYKLRNVPIRRWTTKQIYEARPSLEGFRELTCRLTLEKIYVKRMRADIDALKATCTILRDRIENAMQRQEKQASMGENKMGRPVDLEIYAMEERIEEVNRLKRTRYSLEEKLAAYCRTHEIWEVRNERARRENRGRHRNTPAMGHGGLRLCGK